MSREHDSMIENNETYPKESHHASKSFFAVLLLCLIAVGGVAAATFSSSFRTPSATPPDETVTTTTASSVVTTSAAPVAATPATTTVRTTTTTVTATTTKASDLFALPLSNRVLVHYTAEPLYNATLDTYAAHTATDFDGEEGQLVRPFADGVVTAVEDDLLWGGCVTVEHGEGVISVYRGIKPSVDVGDELTTDDTLGALATIPCESDLGPHLHMELYKDGKAADVAMLFQGKLTE